MCDPHLTDEERRHRPTGPVALVDELVVALTNARIYSSAHPRVQGSLENLHGSLQHMLREHGGRSVALGVAEGFLFFDQRPLLSASLSAQRLIQPLKALESGGISFDRRTSVENLHDFVRFLGREVGQVEHFKQANQALDQKGCAGVRFLPPFHEGSASFADTVDEQLAGDAGEERPDGEAPAPLKLDLDFDLPVQLYQDVVAVMQDAMLSACRGHSIDDSPVAGLVEKILKQVSSHSQSMLNVARYEKYDAFTFGHSIRVCFIALNFARHLTQDPRALQRIGLAALMHDIGKSRIPFDILHSTERLSQEERLQLNMHTIHGGQILLETAAPDPLAVAVAFTHHQHAEGGGYPNSLRCGHQSPATMIVKIADVFEALTAVRPYKPRMPSVRAYRVMMDMEGHFDPSLLRKFIAVNGVYPAGTHVRLSTGEVARVDDQTDSLLEPCVTTIAGPDGLPLDSLDREALDLREVFGRNKIQITGSVLDPALEHAA